MFKRILVANRGEIALRVMRTAREMGIESVAVYSDVDRSALHARLADRAIPLGGALPGESYLDIDKILAAAARGGAEAVHPGYGFLAENAEFARRVVAAGLAWIGPPPAAIESMGDKITSRRIMKKAGVPFVPGMVDPVADVAAALDAAEKIGFPVMLKAAAGGGGKGIRTVHEASELEGAFRTASGEAISAFGDGRIYLERYLEHPRHVEIQVLLDQHGNGVHLGERDCSVQRRHQKLVEETPSPVVDAELRAAMGKTALDAARSVDYVGAGTVEFMYCETPDGRPEFFFLEMNTRLQVEHPITEMVTGRDIVRDQLRIADGEVLGYTQEDVEFRGHAIEVRINAEDPAHGFVPSTGTISNLRFPGGPWVRIDSSLYRGMEVGLNYDPMLAKVIAWGPDRPAAIARMIRALQEMNVGGVRTSAPACLVVLRDERFRSGIYDTHILDGIDMKGHIGDQVKAAAVAATLHRWTKARRRSLAGQRGDRQGWIDRGRGQVAAWRDLPHSSTPPEAQA